MDFDQDAVIQQHAENLGNYIIQVSFIAKMVVKILTFALQSMDNGDKLTMVKLMDLIRRLLNELDEGGLPKMAFSNILVEMVDEYHCLFGIKTRQLVQKIVYAMMELPGNALTMQRLRSDITSRLEREHRHVGGQLTTLGYYLPFDENHLRDNPPFRRIPAFYKLDKSTQTDGIFHSKPVQALIME